MQVGELFVKMGLDDKLVDQGIDKNRAKVQDFGERLERDFATAGKKAAKEFSNSFGAAKEIGQSMTVAGLGMAAGLGVAVNTAMNFDAQMSAVSAKTGATAQEFEELRKQAIELGASTSFSSTQSAEAMEMLAAAGMDVNKIMDAMPGVLSAAAASGEEMAIVAETMGSALNSFGIEAAQAGHVADVLAKAANLSAIGVTDLQYTFKYAAPVAKQLGYSMEEITAAAVEMGNAGIKGEQAGTILRSSMLRLIDPPKEAAAQIDKLKLSITDNAGKMLPLGDIIGQLNEKTANMTEAQRAAALATIFGTEAVSGMMVLIGNGRKAFDDYTKSLINSNGAAAETAKVMQDNLKGAVDQLQGTIESAGITIGSALAPAIRTVANGVTELINKFNSLNPETQKTVATVGALVAAITLIGGPLLMLIGFIPSITAGFGTIAGLFGTTAVAAGGTAAATTGIGSALAGLTGPVGIAVGALGLIGYHLTQRAIPNINLFSDEVSESTQKAVTSFLALERDSTTAINNLNWSGQAVTTEMVTGITSKFDQMKNQIVAGIEQQNAQALASMQSFFTDSTALTVAREELILQAIKASTDGQKKTVNDAYNEIVAIYRRAAEENRKTTESENQVIARLRNEMTQQGIQALTKGEVESKVILERMKAQHKEITAEEAAEVVKNSLKVKDESIKAANDTYAQRIAAIIRMRDETKVITADEAEKLIAEATRAKDGSIQKAEEMHSGVVAQARAQAEEFVAAIDWQTGEVLSKWGEMLNGLNNAINRFDSEIMQPFREKLRSWGFDMGEQFTSGFSAGISGGTLRVSASADTMAGAAIAASKNRLQIKSPSKVMEGFGEMVAAGMAQGISKGTNKVKEQAEKMANAITQAAQAMSFDLSAALDLTKAKLDLEEQKLGQNATESAKLAIEIQRLSAEKESLAAKIEILNSAYTTAKNKLGETHETTKKYNQELRLTQIELEKTEVAIQQTNIALDQQKEKATKAAKEQIKAFSDLTKELEEIQNKHIEQMNTAKESYLDQVESINQRVLDSERQLTEQYERELEQRAYSLSNFTNLFEAVQVRDVSGQALLDNLKGQVSTFEDWQKNIAELAAKGIDEGLLEQLRQMGPEAAPEIAALNTLTNEQLTQYVDLWRQKQEMAKTEAVTQLEDQRILMNEKMQIIRQEAEIQLEAYRQEWEKKNAEIRKNTETEINRIHDKFKDVAEKGTKYGVELMSNFVSGMESQLERLQGVLETIGGMVGFEFANMALPSIRNATSAALAPAMAGSSAGYYNNTGGNVINVTVADGESLERMLIRRGVRL